MHRIRRLTHEDTQLVLDFAYSRERENLAIIGSFSSYKDTLAENRFWGYFDGETLIGLGAHLRYWNRYVAIAEEPKVIEGLTDIAVRSGVCIRDVRGHRKYAEVIVRRLEEQHALTPTIVKQQRIYLLSKENFVNCDVGDEEVAQGHDLDELICIHRELVGRRINEPIEEFERERTAANEHMVIRRDSVIAAKVTVQAYSRTYFQLGGLATLPHYQKRGFAKGVMSAMCERYFEKGIPYALLFVGVDNVVAQRVYSSLGFEPEDDFLIAQYR